MQEPEAEIESHFEAVVQPAQQRARWTRANSDSALKEALGEVRGHPRHCPVDPPGHIYVLDVALVRRFSRLSEPGRRLSGQDQGSFRVPWVGVRSLRPRQDHEAEAGRAGAAGPGGVPW